MPANSSSALAASQRALPLVARNDLIARTIRYRQENYWVIKDPLSLEYFRLRAEQYAVLQLLDGKRTLEQIREALARQFPLLRTTPAQLHHLITDLFQKGLIWSARPGQANTLGERRRARRGRQARAALQNLLFIRLPGWDPQPLLDRTWPMVRWCFHPLAIGLGLAVIIAAWCSLLSRFGEFQRLLPTFGEFTSPQVLVTLWLMLGAVKVMHEFGHALACKHFGGECHEIGLALLVFSPCMYCDVSDSSMLPSRWQRIGVGLAGIYVELVLSSLAFFTWWHTNAGWVHHAALAVFVVTNVSTILFNLNPLLRLDGYYILSDLLEVPNLRAKANQLLERILKGVCLGIMPQEDPFLPQQGRFWFVLYALAAMIYRWQLTLLICLVSYATLKPFGLGMIGLAMGVAAAIAALLGVVVNVTRAVRHHYEQVSSSWRPPASIALLILALASFLFAPLPLPIQVPLVVQPYELRHVYVSTEGELARLFVQPGQQVEQGQPLALLEDFAERDRFDQLRADLEKEQVEVHVQRVRGDGAGEAIATESLRDLHEEAENQRQRLARLWVTAPCRGRIVAPPPVTGIPPSSADEQLGRWQGTPLEQHNLGALLQPGTHLLSIAPHDRFAATLLIDQQVRQEFRRGESVRVKIESLPAITFCGTVESCSAWIDAPQLPVDSLTPLKRATAQSEFATRPARFYQATVLLPESASQLVWGMRGAARIVVTRRSAASWVWRYLRKTLNFRL